MEAAHQNLKRRSMTPKMLLLTVFCCVSGGPYGLESLVSSAGPGMALLLIILVPIFWALPDALTTAELATAIPEEGGYVVWVRRAMGPFWSFLNAWWTWLYALVDAALYPVIFTAYLGKLLEAGFHIHLLSEDGNKSAKWAVAVVVVAAFTWLNIRGTKLVGKSSSAFAYIIIAPFALMTVWGLARMAMEHTTISMSLLPAGKTGIQAIGDGLAVVMWNYLGWDALSTIAEEVDQPAKAYPLAIFVGIPLVTLVYLLPTFVGLIFFPAADKWGEGSWPDIATAVGGAWLSLAVNVVGLVSPIALFTASLLGSSRVPLIMAEEGFLPKALRDIHPKYGTPWKALLVCGAIYVVLVNQSFHDLVDLNVILYSVALFLECGSLLMLRWKEPDLLRPFKVPGGWPVLILVFLFPVAMISLLIAASMQDPEEAKKLLPTLIAVGSGPVVYAVVMAVKRFRSSASGRV